MQSAIAAAFDWWRDAGVDCDFADDATVWLADPEAKQPAPAAPPQTAPRIAAPPPPPRLHIGGDAESWPQSFAAFAPWWAAEPSLDDGHTAGRVAPRGTANAALMILAEQPEAEDGERLLSGPQGQLLDRIVRALGLGEEDTYFASVLPRHMPMADWAALAGDGLGELAIHHIQLAAPQRLLLLGSNVSSLVGHDPANSDGFLALSGQEARRIPVLAAPALAALAARPKGKARLWNALLDWTAPD